MARTKNIDRLCLGTAWTIALLIAAAILEIALTLEPSVGPSAITSSTSSYELEDADNDDNTPIDQLLSELQPNASSSGMLNSDDGIVRAEMDLMFTEEQWASRQNRINGSRYRRKALAESHYLWPYAIVPYVISGTFNDKEIKTLKQAMQQLEKYSCVRFRERTSKDQHYVQVTSANKCESYVGRQSFPQPLNLKHECAMRFRMVVHELCHALGFEHEHNRPDRDEFVTVIASNVEENMYYNFAKANNEKIETFGVPYNYLSIMHYSDKAFSKNRHLLTTIHAKNSLYQHLMGTSNGLQFTDVKQLNKMYQCAEQNRCPRRMKCPGDGFVGQDCKCYCRPTNSINSTQPAVICSECTDYDEWCSLFRQRGLCTHRLFSDHMTYRCPQACNRCTVNVVESPSTSSDAE